MRRRGHLSDAIFGGPFMSQLEGPMLAPSSHLAPLPSCPSYRYHFRFPLKLVLLLNSHLLLAC